MAGKIQKIPVASPWSWRGCAGRIIGSHWWVYLPVMVIKSGSLDHLDTVYVYIYIWLVVWNHGIFWLSKKSWECHHPNWRTHFFRGVETTNQYIYMKMIYVGFTQCHKQLPFGGGFRKKTNHCDGDFGMVSFFLVSHIIQLKFRSLRSDGNSWAQREEWTSSGPGIAVISTEFLWPELCWNLFFSNALGA